MASVESEEVYFAGPLFDQAEKDYNLRVTQRIETELGLTVFLPQRDGLELAKLQNMTPDEEERAIFHLDEGKVVKSKALVIVLDGAVTDPGAAWELGAAYESKKNTGKPALLVGLHTDVRTAFPDHPLNPMNAGSLDYITHSEDELIEYLRKRIDIFINTPVSS